VGYLAALSNAGFGRVEIRARLPYRYLHPRDFPELTKPVMLESIEIAAYKVPGGPDGPAIFSGRTATYIGPEQFFCDEYGHLLPRGAPTPISDAAAKRLTKHPEIVLTDPTWHVRGGGCC
jgi:hypothetical protein